MQLIIHKNIFEKFPGLNVGIIIARGINNKGKDEKIYKLLEEVEELIKDNFIPEDLAKYKLISSWRSAYMAFGAKPKKYHSSIEALMRKILANELIPRINKLVDLYNYLSLKYIIPMGGDDLKEVVGDIHLTFAKGDEVFIPIGKGEKSNPKPGEVIYKDAVEVLCRRWNWRECYKTRITENTKDVILYAEGLPPLKREELEKLLNEAIDLVKCFLGGDISYSILDKKSPELNIDKFINYSFLI
jgi:lysyl-tRNA synthetase class 2